MCCFESEIEICSIKLESHLNNKLWKLKENHELICDELYMIHSKESKESVNIPGSLQYHPSS